MQKNILVYFLLLCFLLPFQAQAAKDPVGWSLSPASGFPAQTNVGSSYVVVYTMTNNLPFAVPLSVTAAYNGGTFSMANECDKTLAPNASCLVALRLQPIAVRNNNVVLTLAYNRNRVPLPQLSTNSTSNDTVDKISGHVSKPLPAKLYVGLPYNVEFTYTNNGNVAVTATAVNVVGFTESPPNGCTSALNPHDSCTVSGTYTPTSTGPVTLSVSYVYSNGTVKKTTSSTTYNNGPNCHQVSGDTTLPLPTSTLIYADNVIKYVFTNYCTATAEQLGEVGITSDSTAATAPTLLKGAKNTPNDTCSGQTVNPTSSCAVYVSVIPNASYPSSDDLTVKATVTYNNKASLAEAASSEIVTVPANQGSKHTLMFVNQCDQTVWQGFSNKSLDPVTPKNWSQYQLAAQVQGAAPATQTWQLSSYTGGTIFGRTLCDTSGNTSDPTNGVCQTGSCTNINNSTGTCDYSELNPTTILEENMLDTTASDGVYDISLINGFNLATEFRSLAPVTPIAKSSDFNFTSACGISAGAVLQPMGATSPNLGQCAWTFAPPSTGTDCTSGTLTDNPSNYYMVAAGASDSCTPGSCSGGEVCGMSWTPTTPPNQQYQGAPISRHCGALIGYWTLADWTSYSTTGQWGATCDLYTHYNMGSTLDSLKPGDQPTYGYSQLTPTLSPNLPAAMLADLFACKPTSKTPVYVQPNGSIYVLNSGYDVCPADLPICNSCGCHNWNDTGTTPAAAQTQQASQCKSDNPGSSNPLFDTYVYDRILWLKEACPTAYSFQFDDPSSQFTCNVSGQRTSYEITFCPGGKDGTSLP